MKRRVLFIIDQFAPEIGGAERQAERLARALVERGYDVAVLTRRTRHRLPRREHREGVDIFRVRAPGGVRLAKISGGLAAAQWIVRHGGDYDVVHCHGINPVEWTAAIARRKFGIPYVVKIPTMDATEPAGDPMNVLGRGAAWRVLGPLLASARSRFFRGANATVTMHEHMAQQFAQRHQVIPNGIDTSRFAPLSAFRRREMRGELGIAEESFVFVYTGRLTPEKNVEGLLAAWTDHALFERARLLLLVPGDGRSAYVSLKPEDAERVRGVICICDPDDVVPYLGAADCFVLPSHREGMSNSLLEAMSVALPVTVSDVPGNRGALAGSSVGVFFNPAVTEEIARALSARVDADIRDLRNEGLRGRDFVRQRYDISKTSLRYSDLYDEVIGAPRRGNS